VSADQAAVRELPALRLLVHGPAGTRARLRGLGAEVSPRVRLERAASAAHVRRDLVVVGSVRHAHLVPVDSVVHRGPSVGRHVHREVGQGGLLSEHRVRMRRPVVKDRRKRSPRAPRPRNKSVATGGGMARSTTTRPSFLPPPAVLPLVAIL